MAIIVKCRPPSISPGEAITLEAPVFKDTTPSVGERAFVWTSETQGGDGLAFSGTVVQIEPVGKNTRVYVSTDGRAVFNPLGKADLAPFCYVCDGTALASLSAKLYHHAWNKIVEITALEATFLDARFN